MKTHPSGLCHLGLVYAFGIFPRNNICIHNGSLKIIVVVSYYLTIEKFLYGERSGRGLLNCKQYGVTCDFA